MAIAGHSCTVERTSDAVAMTTEAATLSSGNTVAQIDDLAKRVFDPATSLVVLDDGNIVDPATYTIDHLFGRVVRSSGTFSGFLVEFTGAYLPRFTEYEARSVSVKVTRELLDTTTLGDQDRKRGVAGLRTAEGDVQVLDTGDTDDANNDSARTDLSAGTARVLSIEFGSVTFRAFVKLDSLSNDSAYDAVQEGAYHWQSTVPTGATRGFGWSDLAGTT